MTSKCLYCQTELEKAVASIEDIIPYSLSVDAGGRCRSENIVCRDCNGELGSQVDEALVDWLPCLLARCILHIPNHKGEVPTIKYSSPTGEQLSLSSELESSIRTLTRQTSNEASSTSYQVIAPSLDEGRASANRIIKTKRARIERDRPNAGIQVACAQQKKRHDPLIEMIGQTLDVKRLSRAICKIAFELLATKLSPELVFSEQFSEVREFIRSDKLPYYGVPCQACSGDSTLPMADPFIHRVIICCDGDTQISWGVVELFGHLRWRVALSMGFQGPNLRWSVTDHPYTGARSEETPIRFDDHRAPLDIRNHWSAQTNWGAVIDNNQVESLVKDLHLLRYREVIENGIQEAIQRASCSFDQNKNVPLVDCLVESFCASQGLGRAARCFIAEHLVSYFLQAVVDNEAEKILTLPNGDTDGYCSLEKAIRTAFMRGCNAAERSNV